MDTMTLKLMVWRQESSDTKGRFETYQVSDIDGDMSFLEMIDILNEQLIVNNNDPVTFDHDCREGICGACSMYINGHPHGPQQGTTTCQLHMRHFNNGDTIVIEPWRAKGFPVIKDLMVDRSAFDRIMQSGGYVSVNTGNAPDGNAIPINKMNADEAFMSAACIGCGACVAACKNASAMLFVGAKVNQLSLLPQGGPERSSRVKNMINTMEEEGFGHCTNTGACEAECPKEISIDNIAKLNREYIRALIKK
ncbi:MAG: succinate dehydrogenase/fumarate reductase iron-sulfur subunit [Candidatus Marinimicrobia bacterium]|nr:succinate dehydrogenase/fumarate reductase iron-sulfur subunit [Candidatus Neomarinimicrobiota bacterium]|tara:strand:- start:39 stop:791 length:753 start_codon:yes stop_codon:yes gene_type:complete